MVTFRTATASVLVLAICGEVFSQQKADLTDALKSITKDELGAHIKRLSDDSFEGRESGSRGGRATGNYIAAFLEKAKCKPLGDRGTYFQHFGPNFRNLIAVCEGSDASRKQECIMIGAHYDHVGYGNASNSFGPIGRIHNGADDNASGISALLEVVDAISKMKTKPARSIVFAFWDGEERGLLGSKHWVSAKPIERQKIKLYLNMDMVGRLRDKNLEIYGIRTAPGLRRILASQNSDKTFLDFRWKLREDSDHYPFVQHSIPAVMLHTGLHSQYHRPTDDFETINVDGVKSVTDFATRVSVALANQPKIPAFRSSAFSETESRQKAFEQPNPTSPPRLGVTLEESKDGNGIRITQITLGSAADQNGLKAGDKLLKIENSPIRTVREFIVQIAKAKSQINLLVQRHGVQEVFETSIRLGGKPKRIGIAWRQDTADPTIYYISKVRPGTPADRADLKVGDRIFAVNGSKITGSGALSKLLRSLPSPIEIQFERRGIISKTKILLDEAKTQQAKSGMKKILQKSAN